MAGRMVGQLWDVQQVLNVLDRSKELWRHARIPVQLEMLCNIIFRRISEQRLAGIEHLGEGLHSELAIYDLQLGLNLLRMDAKDGN